MKQKHHILKSVAVAVLLFIGVSVNATTTITVGSSGASYTTIVAAYAAITDATGGYLIELQGDYSPAGETYPIVLGAATNANSVTNSISIQPKAGNATTFTFTAATGQIFDLSGATWVTIDGLNATKFVVNNTAATVSQCVRITNDASNNTIKNITAKNVCTASSTGAIAIMAGTTNTTGEDGNTISNCTIMDGATKYACGIYVGDAKATNTTIQNNNIENISNFSGVSSNGIAIVSADNTNGVTTVLSNKIYWKSVMSLPVTTTANGINGISCAVGRTSIESNVIGYGATQNDAADLTGAAGCVFYGIYINAALAFPCQNNVIANLTCKQVNATATTSYGIYLASAGAGTISSNSIENITVLSNGGSSTLTNQLYGILNSSSDATEKVIRGNTVRNCSATGTSTGAVCNIGGIGSLTAAGGFSTYSNNTVYGLSAGYSSSTALNNVYGISLGKLIGSSGVLIERNQVYDLYSNASSSTLIYGIKFYEGSPSITIKNNMVTLGNGFSKNITIYGMFGGSGMTTTNVVEIYHNSVYIGGEAPAGASKNTFAFYTYGTVVPANYEIKNNIFANRRTSTSTDVHYAIGLNSTPAGFIKVCDTNLYWADPATLGFLSGTTKATLADWAGVVLTGSDATSFSSDPKFMAATDKTPNLHINKSLVSEADNNGTYIANVANDIDNETRLGSNSKADIGADEYDYTAPTTSTPPAVPTAVSISEGDTQLTVAFTAPASDGGSPIINYKYSIDGGVTFNPCDPAQTTSPILISGLSNGVTYSVQIKAISFYWDGAPTTSLTAAPKGLPIDAPSSLAVTAGDKQLSIAFTAPANDGGSPITNYKYSTNNGLSFIACVPAQTTSPIIISGLTNDRAYIIRIRAVNGVGDGPKSDAIQGTPVAPSAVGQVKANLYAVYTNNGGIQIQSADQQFYKIVNTVGQTIAKGRITSNNHFVPISSKGIVIIQINKEVNKVILTK